jgi:hypothetical protein
MRDLPLIQWVSGALSKGVKWQRREAEYTPPTNAEDRETSVYTSTPPYVFMAYCLVTENCAFCYEVYKIVTMVY